MQSTTSSRIEPDDHIERLNLSDITDCIQMRVGMCEDAIADYQALLRNKKAGGMPPVKAVRDEDGSIYVWDGNHTIEAARRNEQATVKAVVEDGTRQDAVKLAAGANRDHGLRRTHEDLRNALRLLLENDEWAKASDRWLASTIGCSHPFVAKWRKSTGNVSSERETADGRRMNTANIGKAKKVDGTEEASPDATLEDGDHDADADDVATPANELPLGICASCGKAKPVDGVHCRSCLSVPEADRPDDDLDNGGLDDDHGNAQDDHGDGDEPLDDHDDYGADDHDDGDRPRLPHVAHNGGNHEWYTPDEYIDAARKVLGTIDLDPASSDIAQSRINATTYYTAAADGLAHPWSGSVWMNPPYTAGLVDRFAGKLCEHLEAGDVTQAVLLVNNATDTCWFQHGMQRASAVCFPKGRIKFLDPDGNPGAPLQGQAVLYFGENVETFTTEFSQFGFCVNLEAA